MILAQQFVDSSTDGGGAFILFAVMCFVFVGILFAVDSLRRRAEERSESEETPQA